eukprot:COSAG05_NODE_957_length_6426_cov_16.557768_8_plen_266_part_00
MCRGENFDPALHWSRETIRGMCEVKDRADSAAEDLGSVLVHGPLRKTSRSRSDAAREKANLPIVFRAASQSEIAFCNWAPLLLKYDPCDADATHLVPAFRLGGRGSQALSTGQVTTVLATVAAEVVPNWEDFDYGGHSLRIGRENALRHVGTRPELLNDLSTHTSMQGRQSYSEMEVDEIVEADEMADIASFQPVKTVLRPNEFGQDRSVRREPIYLSAAAGPKHRVETRRVEDPSVEKGKSGLNPAGKRSIASFFHPVRKKSKP